MQKPARATDGSFSSEGGIARATVARPSAMTANAKRAANLTSPGVIVTVGWGSPCPLVSRPPQGKRPAAGPVVWSLMAVSSRDELIARNRARSQQLRGGGGLPRPPAPDPPGRRVVSFVEAVPLYAILFICLVVALAGLISGDDYFRLGDVPARVWAVVLGMAAFLAVFFIGGHYWPKIQLILGGGWLVAGAVVGVASGDEEVIAALWGLAVLGIFLAFLYVFQKISRAKVIWAVGVYLVISVVLVAFGQLGLVVALAWLLVVAGIFALPGYVAKRLKRRQPQSLPPAPRRLPG